jgi:hypothetical protein
MAAHKHTRYCTMEQKAAAVFWIRIHIDLTLLNLVPDPRWECVIVYPDPAMKLFYLDSDPEQFNILF